MGKVIKGIFFLIAIFLFLNGCHSSVEKEDMFQFKNSYVGDNGAVGHITRQLPSPKGEHISGLELKTTEEPYGIIVNYRNKEITEEIEKNYKETALYNATFILALVKNADWVKFNFIEKEYKITRAELQNWYGKDVREFINEEELSAFIQAHLKDKNGVNQFFNE
ncbi:DUF4825 domain-containing protein [Pseudobacillus wudalianchiensis]|uniref:DUF4825 domain-containing protein n=1 Tax=Pseudobacillus wudalianchiensis TaxID=1743143 RepID=A0A1B9AJA8_9BACI|nr:DUF4825 domain-containing protein [Bacillus wudalianchiensis]OCA83929.1 hypothetical protein A8F95_13220 [Bacillus wudalianchiensis]